MAEKRDYYEVLGVPKNADEAALKKPIVSLQRNIIPTPILEIKKQKQNLKKHRKPMPY